MNEAALVLFAHGARDPNWAAPFRKLQQLVQRQMPDTPVSLAFLELMSPSLPELTAQLATAGCVRMTVVPVFLGQGGHVLRDLPSMVDGLCRKYPGLRIHVAKAAGENDGVLEAIARYCISSAS